MAEYFTNKSYLKQRAMVPQNLLVGFTTPLETNMQQTIRTSFLATVIASFSLATFTLDANAVSKPGTPNIELLTELPDGVENVEDEDIVDIGTDQKIKTGSPRDILLADVNRVGYGAGATGGTNIVEVSSETEFFNAITVSNNYVLISPTLANKTFTRNTKFETHANNITIDGSLAPGFKIKVGTAMPRDRWLFRFFGDNIIIHNIEGEGIDFYQKNNQSFLNFYGKNVWIDKVTATGFDDDFINILLDSDYITVSRIRSYNTNKSVIVFNSNAGQSDTKLTVHSSWMESTQRGPWLNSGYAHSFNNLVVGTWAGAGRNDYFINHSDPGFLISENNTYENSLYDTTYIAAHEGKNEGYIEIVGDTLDGVINTGQQAKGNISISAEPSLFSIPYNYSNILKPENEVKAYVQANAGADR